MKLRVVFVRWVALVFAATALLVLSGCISSRPFPDGQGAFPELAPGSEEPPPVSVNIYFQATANMQELITTEGSQYRRALEAVLSIPGNWGSSTLVDMQNNGLFRFDVQNQELIAMDGEFAYPLDYPEQVRGDYAGAQLLNYGVFHEGFYYYGWYLTQGNRSPVSFGNVRADLEHYPHWYISSAINEINRLRNAPGEISVVMTNFMGNPNETSAIRNQLAAYLTDNTDSAVATLAFQNGGLPFYILVLGSAVEVSEFSSWLMDDLANMRPEFAFYTMGSVVKNVSDNSNVRVRQEFPGVRRAFDRDIHPNERESFNRLGTPLYYTIWDNLIENGVAQFSLYLEMGLLDIPIEMIDISHGFRLMFMDAAGNMQPVGSNDVNNNVRMSYALQDNGEMELDIWVDMAVFEHITATPVQAVLVLDLDASLVPDSFDQRGDDVPRGRLIDVQEQFMTEINRGGYFARSAEVYIHFIYR